MARFAMLGTRGVPARYGGFETAVEEIGARLVARGHAVTVYCRNAATPLASYRGIDLVHRPAIRRRALETLSHTGFSVLHAIRNRPDAAVLFNAGNAVYIPVLNVARIPTAVHMDGLEWKRAKWKGVGAIYYKHSEALAARRALAVIADANGIARYLEETYRRDSYYIPYGAPIITPGHERLHELGLEPGSYHLVVSRMEPENHVDVIVEGYRCSGSSLPLVVVGSSPYGDRYIDRVQKLAKGSDVRFVGSLWDQELLDQLYAHCRSYLHGHSVGGTNPSLLRALGAGAAVTSYAVSFNREVTAGNAYFFATATEVAQAITSDDQDPGRAAARGRSGQEHVRDNYDWDDVTDRYEKMLLEIVRP